VNPDESGRAMRWTYLFADLESQAAGLAGAERQGEVAERTRIETGRLTLVGRLRGAVGHPLALRCAGVGPCNGTASGCRAAPSGLSACRPDGPDCRCGCGPPLVTDVGRSPVAQSGGSGSSRPSG
jgi:hypothetical protein